MVNSSLLPQDNIAGVVGLGLMGSSIVVSLLISGHPVIAIAPVAEDMALASERINNHLIHCEKSGILLKTKKEYLDLLTISEDYSELYHCSLVLECVIEIIEVKAEVYKKIEAVVTTDCIIASNTSAIPISELQARTHHPDRFLGIHWAEPSYLTRFMEITCGNKTAKNNADRVFQLAHYWGKEPTLLQKDIRGFVTNRLMYAVYREGLNLVEKGQATIEDVDKAFRYDAGSWMTLMGIFRRMDFLGLEDYNEICKNIFPSLCNQKAVPALMQELVDGKCKGVQGLKGLYHYTADEAAKFEEAFASFNEDIYRLAAKYPSVVENVFPINEVTIGTLAE